MFYRKHDLARNKNAKGKKIATPPGKAVRLEDFQYPPAQDQDNDENDNIPIDGNPSAEDISSSSAEDSSSSEDSSSVEDSSSSEDSCNEDDPPNNDEIMAVDDDEAI
jgi:hypothetical protein